MLSPCALPSVWFSELKALPQDRRPVTSWPDQDEAWADVANGVREAAVLLRTA